MILDVPPGGLRRATDVDLSDLTTATRTGPARWVGEGQVEIPFTPEPTGAEQAAIRRRLMTRDPAEESRVAVMQAAAAPVALDLTATGQAVAALLAHVLADYT